MWLEVFGKVDTLIFYILCGVAGLILMMTLGVIIASCFTGSTSAASSMDFNIVLGGLLVITSVLIRGVNTKWLQAYELNILCQAFHAILLVGLTFFIGGLLIKVCGILHHHRNQYNKHQSAVAHEWKPNVWMVLLILVDVAIVVVWAVWVWKWQKNTSANSWPFPNKAGVNGQSLYACSSSTESAYWQIAASAYHGFLLLLAAFIGIAAAVKARGSQAGTEARAAVVVIWNTVLVTVASIVMMYVYDKYPKHSTEYYAIHGGLMFWAVFFANLVLLCARMIAHNRHRDRELNHYEEANPKGDRALSDFSRSNRSSANGGNKFDMPRENANSGEFFSY